jgi:hypothetical protein
METIMLYDPKWKKSDVLSLEGLIAWLERQPASKEYTYTDHRHCLIAQYLTASGFEVMAVSGSYYKLMSDGGVMHEMPEDWNYIALGSSWMLVDAGKPRTFGAALKFAKDILARRGK